MSDQPANSLFEARGILLCPRCGVIAAAPADQTGPEAPACAVCGSLMQPRDIKSDSVGTDPKNALFGFCGLIG